MVKQNIRLWLLFLIPLPMLIIALLMGPSEVVNIGDALCWMGNRLFGFPKTIHGNPDLIQTILIDVRMPRVLLTLIVGGSLASAGTALQALFRNPLVSPYILGLSAGSAFGAALAMTIPWLPLQPTAFAFGILAVGLAYFLARSRKSVSVVSLILSGVIITGIFTALLTIVQFLTDPFKLQTIVHWTMGNLHNASWAKLKSAAPFCSVGIVWLYLFRWRMNVLAMGDEETRAVGLNPEREKLLILIPATMVASAAIAVAGVIGLIGLVIPHMIRMMIGPDNTNSLPASFTFGGAFLLLVDTFSRTIATFEIPIGVFTTLLGGPFFIFLLRRARIGWEV